MNKAIPLFFFAFSFFLLQAQDRVTGATFASRSEVIAPEGMAATSHPLASQIAIDVLKKGGNAIDAAIAANAALGLMEPTGCGVGGDLFAIVWSAADQKLYGLNGSGRSPMGLSLEYFEQEGLTKIPAYGPLPVSVPGAVDAWFALHAKFGSQSMSEILAPAIHYAEEGFPLTELIAHYMQKSIAFHSRFPNVDETYRPQGQKLEKGELYKNPYLASTYKALAKGGRDAFYTGEIATTIAQFIQSQGGFLSVEDLAQHHSEWVAPMSVNYRGYDVWELPPNGQGIAALQILQIMEGYDLAAMGFGSAAYIHHFVEAKKLAFEDRAKYYADPDFNGLDYQELLSDEYASKRRALINREKAAKRYDAGKLEQGNTIYLTVADAEGNMVSLIQSNYRGMGSGMVPPKLGFMLQDRGELFSLEEDHHNIYAPGKRPFHTIIPAFITKDGKPFISFGLMG
jgi:gamma-glutamyltranspeptidase/glutathione hydrolase